MTLGDSGLSILEHVYQRLNVSKYIEKVVFAIPDSEMNNPLADYMDSKGIEYIRGSEDDVLDRFYKCAIKYNPTVVVRATCDNPLVSWEIADKLCEFLDRNVYVSAKEIPLGTGVEVFTMASLQEAFEKSSTEVQHEHVTPYIYQNYEAATVKFGMPDYRLTVDEERDLYVINELYKILYKGTPIPISTVIDYLNDHQELADYNRDVHQKKLGE